ncbi:HD domain-containing protein [Oceanospirillum linum]|nr:HD domain-containing protein [Oceanospirillum linum]SEF53725.1 HD domain-containing protein [Oleiphilus messinensis]SMP04736.1 HD domain-containing protein [Oceanospirillum linum]
MKSTNSSKSSADVLNHVEQNTAPSVEETGRRGTVRASAMQHPLVERARQFASDAHGRHEQVRRYTNEDYIVHPQAVAERVAEFLPEPEVLAAAWLHDVVEDTDVDLDEIRQLFGDEVALLVEQLTSGPHSDDLERAERKLLDRMQLQQADKRAKTIKLADIIDNTNTIAERDPEFAALYLPEKYAMLQVLKQGRPELFALARQIIEEGLQQLDQLSQKPPYEDG